MRISILGVGRVGSSIASHIIASDIDATELYLHDIDIKKVMADMQDLKDMAFILGSKVDIKMGVGPSDLYIITAGIPRKISKEKHNIEDNWNIVRYCLTLCDLDKPIIIATNPKEKINERVKELYADRQIYVSGFMLDNVRAERKGEDPERIAEFILDNKGYTNHGITAEVMNIIRGIQYG